MRTFGSFEWPNLIFYLLHKYWIYWKYDLCSRHVYWPSIEHGSPTGRDIHNGLMTMLTMAPAVCVLEVVLFGELVMGKHPPTAMPMDHVEFFTYDACLSFRSWQTIHKQQLSWWCYHPFILGHGVAYGVYIMKLLGRWSSNNVESLYFYPSVD